MIALFSSGASNNWLYEDYWFNAGSTATYSFICSSPIDLAIIEGDNNFNNWNNALLNGNEQNANTFASTTVHTLLIFFVLFVDIHEVDVEYDFRNF